MTREEAIKIIKECKEKGFKHTFYTLNQYHEALEMAIKALEQEPCYDAISRQAVNTLVDELARAIFDERCFMSRGRATSTIMQDILDLPPVNPQEPKTGHWIEIAQYSDGKHKIECSECKSHIFDRGHANSFNVKNRYKYCPNCGCRMVEPQESEEDMNEVGVEIVKTEETEKCGIKYLNINVSNSEVERKPDIVRLCTDAGILEYVKTSGDVISRDFGDYPDEIPNQFDNLTGSMNI